MLKFLKYFIYVVLIISSGIFGSLLLKWTLTSMAVYISVLTGKSVAYVLGGLLTLISALVVCVFLTAIILINETK